MAFFNEDYDYERQEHLQALCLTVSILTGLLTVVGIPLAISFAVRTPPPAPPSPPVPPMSAGKETLRDLGVTQSVKGSSTTLCSITIQNESGEDCWIQLFDKPNPGSVTLGTTNPDWEWRAYSNGQEPFSFSIPVSFVNGIQAASTTTEKGATPSSPGVIVFISFT